MRELITATRTAQLSCMCVLLRALCDISLRFRRSWGWRGNARQETQVMDPLGARLVFRKCAGVPVPRDHSAALSGFWVFGLRAHAVFFILFIFYFFEKVKCKPVRRKMHYVGKKNATNWMSSEDFLQFITLRFWMSACRAVCWSTAAGRWEKNEPWPRVCVPPWTCSTGRFSPHSAGFVSLLLWKNTLSITITIPAAAKVQCQEGDCATGLGQKSAWLCPAVWK